MQRPVKLVIFDLAGTTVEDNNDVPRVLQSTLAKFDTYITLNEAIAVMGIPKPVAILKLMTRFSDPIFPPTTDQLNAIHETFQQDMIAFYEHDTSVREKTGVSETFAALKEMGIKIAIDTGFDRSIANVVLARMGWSTHGLIDYTVTSDEVERGRPYPDMIFKAMDELGIQSPLHVGKIGDTPADLHEGTQAGCAMVVGITSGAFSKAELLKEPHTHLIEQIPELILLLSRGPIPSHAGKQNPSLPLSL